MELHQLQSFSKLSRNEGTVVVEAMVVVMVVMADSKDCYIIVPAIFTRLYTYFSCSLTITTLHNEI